MTFILQSAVHILGLSFLYVADAHTDGLHGINLDEMSHFHLSHPNHAAESLLFSRLVPPRVDYDHSVGGGEIQGLTAALESSNLYDKANW